MDFLEIKILHTAIERAINHELSKNNLTYTQATVLQYLEQNKNNEICQKDIEANLGLRHPTVSSILKKMQQKSLIFIHQKESDKRFHYIGLTQQSLCLLEDMHNNTYQTLEKAYGNIEQRRLLETKQVLLEMIDNLQVK